MNVIEVDKDQLPFCVFKRSESFATLCERREYSRKLHQSMLLGSSENKVRIVFNTVEGYRGISAAVWGATEKFILLKDGLSIPAESVAYVSLD